MDFTIRRNETRHSHERGSADRASGERASSDRQSRVTSEGTRSDASEHSYHVRLNTQPPSTQTPFAAPVIQATPAEDTFEATPRRQSSDNWREMFSWPRIGRNSSQPVHLSIELPARRGQHARVRELDGDIQRRRRRIPVWLAVGFGIFTVFGFLLAISLAPLTIYNYRIIHQQRAAKGIKEYADEAVPLLHAIYTHTVGAPVPAGLRKMLRRLF